MSSPAKKGYAVGAALVTLALVVGAAALYRFDPARYGFYPRCQLHAMTGLACPGCGGLRALHALLHGEIVAALRLNPLFVAGLPVTLALAGVWWTRKRRNPAAPVPLPARWFWVVVGIVVLFGIVRNLPAAAHAGFTP
jgi:hypothetical protein